jgi:hypothetical protein
MGELDKFEHWRFEGVALAVESASVRLKMRTHQHVYPHTPGAARERMGRGLYEIHVTGRFDQNLPYVTFGNSLTSMGVFRALAEDETIGDLVIPWIGTIRAQCEEFELTEKNTNRSGLGFTATFVEDMNFEFPIQNFIRINRAPMADSLANFEQQGYEADIFSKIAAGVSFVLGIKDQFELYSALVQSKLSYLEGLFREADAVADELMDPSKMDGLNAFASLWETLRTVANDIADKGVEFRYYTTPIEMTIQQLAAAIYAGDVSKSGDLLGLNAIEDTLAIPVGTKIRYYAAA